MNQQQRKPRIVAIETSSRVGSVAIGLGPDMLERLTFGAELNHAVELLPAMDQLTCRQGWPAGGVDHLYVSAGPGSFTGLRIGITVARALALAEVVYQLGWQLAEANQFVDPKALIPIYLRRPEAEEVWNARHAGK